MPDSTPDRDPREALIEVLGALRVRAAPGTKPLSHPCTKVATLVDYCLNYIQTLDHVDPATRTYLDRCRQRLLNLGAHSAAHEARAWLDAGFPNTTPAPVPFAAPEGWSKIDIEDIWEKGDVIVDASGNLPVVTFSGADDIAAAFVVAEGLLAPEVPEEVPAEPYPIVTATAKNNWGPKIAWPAPGPRPVPVTECRLKTRDGEGYVNPGIIHNLWDCERPADRYKWFRRSADLPPEQYWTDVDGNRLTPHQK